MNFVFYLFLGIVALLLLLFVWSLRRPKGLKASASTPAVSQDLQSTPITHLPQIRHALAPTDYEFISGRMSRDGLRRMRRERRHVALKYLLAMRLDFDRLLRTAKIIAKLSPEIGVGQELERLSLTIGFLWRFRVIQLALYLGYSPLPQVDGLGNLVSGLSVRLDGAMKKLGEKAALVAEMASSADRGRVGLA